MLIKGGYTMYLGSYDLRHAAPFVLPVKVDWSMMWNLRLNMTISNTHQLFSLNLGALFHADDKSALTVIEATIKDCVKYEQLSRLFHLKSI